MGPVRKGPKMEHPVGVGKSICYMQKNKVISPIAL